MIFELSEYLKFYWVLYFSVREKYFPKGTWRGKVGHRSPKLWTYEIERKDTIGHVLFGCGAKFFYLVTTKFAPQNTIYQKVDYAPLILAFNLIGCNIDEEEIVARHIDEVDIPKHQFKLFQKKFDVYKKLFPDLEKTINQNIEKIITKTKLLHEDKNESVLIIVDNEHLSNEKNSQSSFNTIDGPELTEKVEVESIDKKDISDLVTSYYNYISNKNYKLAFDIWDVKSKLKFWDYSDKNFEKEHLYISCINQVHILNIDVNENLAACTTYIHANISFKYSHASEIINTFSVDSIFQFQEALQSMVNVACQHRLYGFLKFKLRDLMGTLLYEDLASDYKLSESFIDELLPFTLPVRVHKIYEVLLQREVSKWSIYKITNIETSSTKDMG